MDSFELGSQNIQLSYQSQLVIGMNHYDLPSTPGGMSIESNKRTPELYVEKAGKWRRVNMEDDMSFIDVFTSDQTDEPTPILI